MYKVVIIDDEKTQLARHMRLFQEILTLEKQQLVVDGQVLTVASTVEDAANKLAEKFSQERPHVLVVDNKIGNSEFAGQTVISILKNKLPDCLYCLLTRETLKSDQFGLRLPNPDIVISKGFLGGSPDYKKYIRQKIFAGTGRVSKFNINVTSEFSELFRRFRDGRSRRANYNEFVSIVEQALFDGVIDDVTSDVIIDEVNGGRSGSVVLSCRISGQLKYGISGVLKISKPELSKREIDNYTRYVKWVLPYTWRVEIMGTGFTENLGAVCYSFAFDGLGKPDAASVLIGKCDEAIVGEICESIFDPNRKMWYSQLRVCEKDASEYFLSDRFYSKPERVYEREQSFISLAREFFGASFEVIGEDSIRLFDFVLKRPTRLINSEDWGPVDECICHGDLNANNILVNPDNRLLAFIDFQNTGWHYVYRDFMSVEGSVRIDWGEDLMGGALESLLAEEISIGEFKAPRSMGYLAEIWKVRKAAGTNFEMTDANNRHAMYLIGAYVHFSWLATRFSGWSRAAIARLLLGAFGSLICLGRIIDSRQP